MEYLHEVECTPLSWFADLYRKIAQEVISRINGRSFSLYNPSYQHRTMQQVSYVDLSI